MMLKPIEGVAGWAPRQSRRHQRSTSQSNKLASKGGHARARVISIRREQAELRDASAHRAKRILALVGCGVTREKNQMTHQDNYQQSSWQNPMQWSGNPHQMSGLNFGLGQAAYGLQQGPYGIGQQ